MKNAILGTGILVSGAIASSVMRVIAVIDIVTNNGQIQMKGSLLEVIEIVCIAAGILLSVLAITKWSPKDFKEKQMVYVMIGVGFFVSGVIGICSMAMTKALYAVGGVIVENGGVGIPLYGSLFVVIGILLMVIAFLIKNSNKE
ncbi:MAG: hypothetical protein IJ471_05525 [Eubacterium sp.]|nr:hypothetical protein [Eubacterium sp.]